MVCAYDGCGKLSAFEKVVVGVKIVGKKKTLAFECEGGSCKVQIVCECGRLCSKKQW
jgi:hypothetical protein